ncbi:hypothetical protein [Hyperthermus butylicus]|uniref:hypothetical protein n=1 Tax=Hyperthermus butylicus TaxID=54248 RepID=UPI00064E22BE|nr:hypothetical protein [Hyperthermus butylicus]
MARVVYVTGEGRLANLSSAASVVVTVLLAAALSGSLRATLYILLMFTVLTLILYMARRLFTRGVEAKLKEIIASMSSSTLTFAEIIEAEIGKLVSRGFWARLSGYQRTVEFHPEQKTRLDKLVLEQKQFLTVIGSDGSGVLQLPAVKLRKRGYEDVIVAYAAPGLFRVEPDSFNVLTGDDYVEVSFEREARHLSGTVTALLTKARKVTVELVYESGKQHRVKLFSGRESRRIEYMGLTEPLVIIGPVKAVTPLVLKEKLKLKNTLLAGYGEFKLRIVLHMPRGRRITKAFTLRLKPLQR